MFHLSALVSPKRFVVPSRVQDADGDIVVSIDLPVPVPFETPLSYGHILGFTGQTERHDR